MQTDLTEHSRVLDVAADIVANGGFDTLTVESLAEAAEVSPELLIEHFGSLQEALVLMLNREFTGIYVSMVDHIERDPEGGRLSRIYYYTLSAVYERPLARTLYTVDRDAMNAIMRSANSFKYIPGVGIRADLIETMQRAGMVRRDVDAGTVSHMLTIFSAGLALTAPHDDLDRIVRGVTDLLAQVVDEENIVDTTPGKAAFFEWAISLTER
ncbi:MAG TPA: TetR/AcrR family transcriptional regulator [Galbitalea sp.]|jgi:AcrR family transcriptional regulator|nr:TetR/AcrR family transcriptional regulator [Galbitalea sp.]